jgi:hypothetical protein
MNVKIEMKLGNCRFSLLKNIRCNSLAMISFLASLERYKECLVIADFAEKA